MPDHLAQEGTEKIDEKTPEFQAHRSSRGRPAHPERAYLKAFLLRICEGMTSTSQLRRFLLLHPLLVIELGFRLALDPEQPFGFDIEQTVPCEFWFRQHLQHLDHDLLTDLLHALVAALKEEIPGLGETVAFDVKHIYAWVRENNPRVYVQGRFDVTHIPQGDPDCRLGVKKSRNQVQPDGSTTTKRKGSSAMAPVWRPRPTRSMAMWCWPNTPNPSMKAISPIFAASMTTACWP